ncbi:MAG TPA: adenylate/guanylate cyclase domain-containing protein, partial [Gaiellaceae bacterium]|nr:adenylate/guanylate cyclase domain-containing protein [Gaiellaceae bacterium]
AAARNAWREAAEAYDDVEDDRLVADDLEAYADAAWWGGLLERAIGLRERAYGAFLGAGANLDAARMALRLAEDFSGRGDLAVASGWFATAERLLAPLPESVEHARFHAVRGMVQAKIEGDAAGSLTSFDRALEIAERLGDHDTQVLARSGKACMLVMTGDVEQGLALHDETNATAAGGAVGPYCAGIAYCATIVSCSGIGDYRRAAEWTDAANRWADRLDVSGFPGVCRLHRAEILRLRGEWDGAEQQAAAACVELGDFDRRVTANGFYEIGEIRRRRGDFAAAEESYRTASEFGREPQPGLALLRLAEGKVGAAVSAVKRSLDEPLDPLSRLQVLVAAVEILIAAGDLVRARAAADELEQIVDAYRVGGRRTPAFEATVQLARARIAVAAGDAAAAVRPLRAARDGWQAVGAPYEVAQARLLLGLAYRRDGDEDAAETELEAALATFERLGASLDAERAKELLGKLEVRRTFLFTDIVDSTRLLETLGEGRWKKLLARHDELLRAAIDEAGGEVIKHTGDGFFAAFGNAQAAVEAAVAIQRALAEEIVAPEVRIGAHLGGAFHTGADADDYGGHGVHVAARVGAAAGAGEILVSRESLAGVALRYSVSAPREQPCKGLDEPLEVVVVDWR